MTEGNMPQVKYFHAFSEPWHARAFALTVALNEAGYFSWPKWSQRLSDNLAQLSDRLDQGDVESRYFETWLQTLESLLADEGHVDACELESLVREWKQLNPEDELHLND